MQLHPHARTRMRERGVTEFEIEQAVRKGERFPAKFGRQGFRRNFSFGGAWRGRVYAIKQVEAMAVWEEDNRLVISVITKYFGGTKCT
jgi:hypothetical protein